jgi:hypothetical protein
MTTTLTPIYGSSSALTVTHLAALGTDANLLAGWSSAVIANGTNASVTEKITGQIQVGTSPNVGSVIYVYLWAMLDDTHYPDNITGAEGTVTITSTNVLNAGAFKLCDAITVDATTSRVYPFTQDVAQWFGGHMPKNYGVFIVHNTGVALGATQVISRSDITKYQNA